jgi:putative ABC transport system permease protein
MSPAFAVGYSARSLAREGSRTVLAVLCIAIGVMAIVALRLASLTLTGAELSGLRSANGGDVSVRSATIPLGPADLAHLDDLQRRGLVTRWTATQAELVRASHGPDRTQPVELQVVDPARYPLAGGLPVVEPAGRDLRSLLVEPGAAVITPAARDLLAARPGDRVQVTTGSGMLTATVRGVVADGGALGAAVLVSRDTYLSVGPLPTSASVTMTTPGAAEAVAVQRDLERRLPLATVRTPADLLRSREQATRQLTVFLDLVGLLALLVGGTGIVHTLQVVLARRRVEIATLKTVGYRGRDLLLLFGLEAAGLGLAGGVLGAGLGAGAGLVLTALVGTLVGQHLAPAFDPRAMLGGVAVGVATSLTFGILPIVRAARARPLAVLRESAEEGWAARALAVLLLLVLGALFCLLASAILEDVRLAVLVVGGGLVGLTILGLGFALVALLAGRLPVPERPGWLPALALLPLVLAAALALRPLPLLAVLLAAAAGLGALVLAAPGSWKAGVRLALRGVGRRPLQSGTTLLALFVAMLSCGAIATIGQAASGQLDAAESGQTAWNVFVFTTPGHAPEVRRALTKLDGVRRSQEILYLAAAPQAVDGVPAADFLARSGVGLPPSGLLTVGSVQGFDLAGGRRPDVTLTDTPQHPGHLAGRLLDARDAGTGNALGGEELLYPPWSLRPGDTITLAANRSGERRTITLVGFFQRVFTVNDVRTLQVDRGFVSAWDGANAGVRTYLSVDPARSAAAVKRLNAAVPTAVVIDVGQLEAAAGQVLRNLLVFVSAIAALAVLAGTVIIANAVALAVIERRREIGIMKAVGFRSVNVLAQLLLENAIMGAIAGASAILLVFLAIGLASRAVLGVGIDAGAPLGSALVLGSAALGATVAGAVAWGPARARPLEVLRSDR